MEKRRYHRNIFWEARFDDFFESHNIKKIIFTNHVKENQYKEGKRIYDLRNITLDFLKKGFIFEVDTEDDKIINSNAINFNEYTIEIFADGEMDEKFLFYAKNSK